MKKILLFLSIVLTFYFQTVFASNSFEEENIKLIMVFGDNQPLEINGFGDLGNPKYIEKISDNEKGVTVSKLSKLFRYTQHYIDFLNSFSNEMKERNIDIPKSALNFTIQEAEKWKKKLKTLYGLRFSCEQNFKTVPKLYINQSTFVEVSKEGLSNTLELYLSEILLSRLYYINNRKHTLDLFKNDKKAVIGPTDPEKYENLSDTKKVFSRFSTDSYHFMSQLALELYTCVEDPSKLSGKTKTLIACSPMLWDAFQGEEKNIGHLDATLEKDWKLYHEHIEKGKDSIVIAKDENGIKHIGQKPIIDWETKLSIIPDFLKTPVEKQKQKKKEKKKRAKLRKKEEEIEKKRLDDLSREELEKEKEEQEQIKKEEKRLQKEYLQKEKRKQEELEKEKLKKEKENFTQEKEEKLRNWKGILKKEENKAINQKTLIEKNEDGIKFEKSLSKGNRLFGKKENKIIEKETIDEIEISNTHKKNLEKIFDRKAFKNVNYGQIKSLWLYINGINSVDESTGGSHKKFYSPNGDVFLTFSHSDSMTYSKKTIPYIRDMFDMIGCGQNYLKE